MSIEFLLSVIIVPIALASIVIALKDGWKRGSGALFVLSIALIFWLLAHWDIVAFYLTNFGGRTFTLYLQLCLLVAASAQFAFSLTTISNRAWDPQRAALLSIAPVLAALRLVTEVRLSGLGLSAGLLIAIEGWDTLISIYAFLLSSASMIMIWVVLFETPRLYRRRLVAMAVLYSAPFVAQFIDLRQYNLLPFIFSLPAYALCTAVIAYEMVSHRFLEASAFIRDHLIDAQVEGVLVIDQSNRIVDINRTVEKILGRSKEAVIGRPAVEVLGNLPGLDKPLHEVHEFERKRQIGLDQDWQYLSVNISPLLDRSDHAVGRIVSWRDYSKKRQAEEAHQKAREEMFVLINAISGVARDAATLEEFLTETIYQIVYPFHSQCVIVFLEKEKNLDSRENEYYLASHFGLNPDALNSVLDIPYSSELFHQVLLDQQPILVENAAQDERIPLELRESGLQGVLMIPLVARLEDENHVLGCMCLGSKDTTTYNKDEIVRLLAICEHIGSLIDNERRRKLSIALTERKGLLRDLHDSVSQKLYGLVALTEAAQAALETGNKIDPSQVLARIGENARQAVREMRLFLYQMQPPDLEKDGLVSAIHHRLSAVEGRADIKARLLADESVAISKEKEVELYYIVQEALNNVLRHAHAKNVTVKLKQGKRNVILEIQDDGCGFDPKNLDRAGLGLANMKERALKIAGKTKITTKPDQGVHIVVTIPRDPMVNSSARRQK
jgi:PAS domain S-box-containing protein